MQTQQITPDTFKAPKAKAPKAKAPKAVKAKAPKTKAELTAEADAILGKAPKLAKAPKKEKPAPEVFEFAAELIEHGRAYRRAEEECATTLHAHAWAIRQALCPDGIYKGENRKMLPRVRAYLDACFGELPEGDKTEGMRRGRWLQIVATTTAEKLGSTNDARAKQDKAARAPRMTEAGIAEAAEDASPSKTKERKASIIGHMNRAHDLLNQMRRVLPDKNVHLAADLQDILDTVQELAC